MTILRDGRLVLRDPGNARFQVWTADGQAAGEWRYRGGFFTSMPMFIDTAGRVYSSTVDFSTAPPWKAALVRYAQDGAPLDTLPVPDWDWKEPTISAQKSDKGNTSTMVNTVPFSAAEQWTFSPLGYFVGGVSDHYAITLFRPEGALRIERVVEPLPIDAAEKANAEEVATDNMRGMVSDWKWNGPPIPDTKPPWAALVVAQDGRIWVQVSQPGERIPEDELEEPKRAEDGRMPAVRKWREPVAFDVFQPDGRYVGRATAPTGFSMYPRPWIRGDTVWAVL
jgi:hypothetical protein